MTETTNETPETTETTETGLVEVFIDGSCRDNPGPGGWAAIVRWDGNEKILTGGFDETTNNRMELMAAVKALGFIEKPSRVKVYTDSAYLADGIGWLEYWKVKNWRTSRGAVKNRDLWIKLDALMAKHDVDFEWVERNSMPEMKRVDGLAKWAVKKYGYSSYNARDW